MLYLNHRTHSTHDPAIGIHHYLHDSDCGLGNSRQLSVWYFRFRTRLRVHNSFIRRAASYKSSIFSLHSASVSTTDQFFDSLHKN